MLKQDSSGNWGWMADTGVKVSCVEEPLGDKVPPGHFHMAHNPQVLIVINVIFASLSSSDGREEVGGKGSSSAHDGKSPERGRKVLKTKQKNTNVSSRTYV